MTTKTKQLFGVAYVMCTAVIVYSLFFANDGKGSAIGLILGAIALLDITILYTRMFGSSSDDD